MLCSQKGAAEGSLGWLKTQSFCAVVEQCTQPVLEITLHNQDFAVSLIFSAVV